MEVMDLWSSTDLTDWVTQYGLEKSGTLKTWAYPDKLKNFVKTTMCADPELSRCIFNKVVYDENRTAATKIYNIENLIRDPIPSNIMTMKIIKAYFRDDWQ